MVAQIASERRFLSIKEYGRATGLSDAGAWRSVARGDVPSIKLGKRILIPVEAIDRLVARAMDHAGDQQQSAA